MCHQFDPGADTFLISAMFLHPAVPRFRNASERICRVQSTWPHCLGSCQCGCPLGKQAAWAAVFGHSFGPRETASPRGTFLSTSDQRSPMVVPP